MARFSTAHIGMLDVLPALAHPELLAPAVRAALGVVVGGRTGGRGRDRP